MPEDVKKAVGGDLVAAAASFECDKSSNSSKVVYGKKVMEHYCLRRQRIPMFYLCFPWTVGHGVYVISVVRIPQNRQALRHPSPSASLNCFVNSVHQRIWLVLQLVLQELRLALTICYDVSETLISFHYWCQWCCRVILSFICLLFNSIYVEVPTR